MSGAILETRRVVAWSGCMEVFLELPESALVRHPSKITVRANRFKRASLQRIGGIPPLVLVAATVVRPYQVFASAAILRLSLLSICTGGSLSDSGDSRRCSRGRVGKDSRACKSR